MKLKKAKVTSNGSIVGQYRNAEGLIIWKFLSKAEKADLGLTLGCTYELQYADMAHNVTERPVKILAVFWSATGNKLFTAIDLRLSADPTVVDPYRSFRCDRVLSLKVA